MKKWWCIRAGRQRLFAAEPWGHHREFSYVERGFYAEQVERLLGLFPQAQLLFLTSENLRRRPAEALAEVRRFLGLPTAPTPRESGEPAPWRVLALSSVRWVRGA